MVNTKTTISLGEIISHMPGNVYWTDINGVYQGCNLNVVKVLKQKSIRDVIGKTAHQLIDDKNIADEVVKIDTEAMLNDREIIVEQEAFDSEGKSAIYFTRKLPLHDADGQVIGLLGISLDITKRKLAEQEAIKAKEAAEAASRVKTEFLANMSHDVKTPMTGVIGMADVMMHDTSAREADRQNSQIIHACGLQVLAFFNNCLELSKMEMQEWVTEEEDFSLEALLAEIQALFLPVAQTKQLAFTFDYDPNLPKMVLSHRTSLYRVLLNLIGNALKFTELGSVQTRVFISKILSTDKVEIGIEVEDTGIGIPEDKHLVIFEKLRRLTPSYQGKTEGSGMGLYIVDQYVKRMGGCVEMKSMVGTGSTFTVLLPVLVSHAALPQHQAVQTPALQFLRHPQTSISPTLEENEHAADERPLILLVEDSPIIQMVTKALLKDAGFQVELASTGAEAIEKFSPGKYGLIYMDIGLPDTDGYKVAQQIREQEKALNATPTPIIALTGHGAIDVQTFCGQAGMQGVLSKPVDRKQLENIWRRYGQHEAITIAGLTTIEAAPQNNSVDANIIDIAATAALLGSEEKAQVMLDLLATELQEAFLPKLVTLIKQKSVEPLHHQLHAMLGTLCYVKTPSLHQAIAKLHSAVQSHHQIIEVTYQQVQQQAQSFLKAYQQMKQ